MLVLFQRKIIYMGTKMVFVVYEVREVHQNEGYLLPGARTEVSDFFALELRRRD